MPQKVLFFSRCSGIRLQQRAVTTQIKSQNEIYTIITTFLPRTATTKAAAVKVMHTNSLTKRQLAEFKRTIYILSLSIFIKPMHTARMSCSLQLTFWTLTYTYIDQFKVNSRRFWLQASE